MATQIKETQFNMTMMNNRATLLANAVRRAPDLCQARHNMFVYVVGKILNAENCTEILALTDSQIELK
jgi:hypothetical protein